MPSSEQVASAAIKRFYQPVVGALVLSFDDVTVRRHLTMAVYVAEPGSRSPLRVNLLVGWAATPDQAEAAANAVDGL
jgi:hypothetical protein